MGTLEKNKEVVARFNKEVIEQGNRKSFDELVSKDLINRSAPPASNGAEGVWNNITSVLRVAFPDIKVEILDQLAEGDKVTSRKEITGTHLGMLMGIAPTHRKIKIDVIDIVRVKDGKYIEHWGINTLQNLIQELKLPS